jgi:hypothetical protein
LLGGSFLFLGTPQKLRSKLGYSFSVETVEVSNPKAVQHGKQQERISGLLPRAQRTSS